MHVLVWVLMIGSFIGLGMLAFAFGNCRRTTSFQFGLLFCCIGSIVVLHTGWSPLGLVLSLLVAVVVVFWLICRLIFQGIYNAEERDKTYLRNCGSTVQTPLMSWHKIIGGAFVVIAMWLFYREEMGEEEND